MTGMSNAPMIPPDKGSPYRKAVGVWDALWRADYRYDTTEDRYGRLSDPEQVEAAPGYTRSFSQLVAGLFERQSPGFVSDAGDDTDGPISGQALSELLHETVAKAAGYGVVVLRPVWDGVGWGASVVAPTSFAIRWAHRRAAEIVLWEFADDPRTDDDRQGLAILERWTPGAGTEPGQVTTEVWTTERDPAAGGAEKLGAQIDTANPPVGLDDHPFVLSASNDSIRRDVVPYVWGWEDLGPVPLWYTNEQVVTGLARLWDQEQDDAEMTRKRVAMPEDLLGRSQVLADGSNRVLARPGFNKSDNIVLLGSSMSAEHGPNGGVTPIEFSDDLIQRERIERRENSLLEMVGINPASIGRNVGGRSDSASAKRADNQMTMNTITAPARRVEQSLTACTMELARLSQSPTTLMVQVREGLKESAIESAETARQLRDADAASSFTLVQTAHPTWTTDQVEQEVERMQGENLAAAPLE